MEDLIYTIVLLVVVSLMLGLVEVPVKSKAKGAPGATPRNASVQSEIASKARSEVTRLRAAFHSRLLTRREINSAPGSDIC